MKRIAGVFVTIFLAVITLTWEPPTTHVDGSTAVDADIAGYKLYCNTDVVDVGKVLEYSLTAYGQYTCAVSVYDSYDGTESAKSVETFFTHRPAALGAPINLKRK